MGVRSGQARELAIRLAGAAHSRRLYATTGAAWERTLAALHEELGRFLDAAQLDEVTVAFLGEGLAVAGVPIDDPPAAVRRLISSLRTRDVEIVSIRRGCPPSELEVLLSFLSSDSADVAAVRADQWLRERGVDHISIKHLKLMRGDDIESFRDVYRRGGRQLSREFQRAAQQGAVSYAAVSDLARSLMEIVIGSQAPVATLLALRDRDDFAMVHSINTGVLVGAQAAALGLSEEQVQQISMAALLHDIGKTKVPEAILGKRSPHTTQEQALLGRHTLEGARILLDTQSMERLPPIVALNHHGPSTRLLAVELCRIADIFDGVRTLRPFDDAAGSRGAVAWMAQHLADRLNPYLFERFAALCRLFDPGDHLRLSSGEIAKVVEPHPELALHPIVEVLDPDRGTAERGAVIKLFRRREHSVVLPVPPPFLDLAVWEVDALG